METKRAQGKIVYLEAVRFIAIFFVLFCHTGLNGQLYFKVAGTRTGYTVSMLLDIISQICVPLFFMVSGACLLTRTETVAYVLKKRVLRMVLVILIIVAIQYFINYKAAPEIGLSLRTYLYSLYGGGAISQQGFLYEYVSFLLILPLLQRMVKVIEDKKIYLYIFLVVFIYKALCPVIEFYMEFPKQKININFLDGAVFYALMGYFIVHESEDIFNRGRVVLLMVAGSMVLLTVNFLLFNNAYMAKEHMGFVNLFTSAFTVTAFVIVRYFGMKIPFSNRVDKIFIFLGNGVFGTYLFEAVLRTAFYPFFNILNGHMPTLVALFIYLTVCVFAGIICSNLLKMIPGLKKLL